jgi:hypothetical protein
MQALTNYHEIIHFCHCGHSASHKWFIIEITGVSVLPSLVFSMFLWWHIFLLMQIAAKINPTGTSESAGQKRPLEDGSGMDWTGKLMHRPSLQSADIALAICVKLTGGNIPDITLMHHTFWNWFVPSSCHLGFKSRSWYCFCVML